MDGERPMVLDMDTDMVVPEDMLLHVPQWPLMEVHHGHKLYQQDFLLLRGYIT